MHSDVKRAIVRLSFSGQYGQEANITQVATLVKNSFLNRVGQLEKDGKRTNNMWKRHVAGKEFPSKGTKNEENVLSVIHVFFDPE